MGKGIGNDVETDLVGESVEIRQFRYNGTDKVSRTIVAGLVRAVSATEGALMLWIELRTIEDLAASGEIWGYIGEAQIGDIVPISITTAHYYGSDETKYLRLRRGAPR